MRTSDKRFVVMLLCGVAVAMAGCGTLDQAALVYASSQTMGVSVRAGTPEKPGLDLTIGYSGLNAASVPVVVQLACENLTADQCAAVTGQFRPILGNATDAERNNRNAEIASIVTDLGENQLDRKELEGRIEQIDENIRSRTDLNRINNEISTLQAQQTKTEQEAVSLSSLIADRDRINQLPSTGQLNVSRADTLQEIADIQTEDSEKVDQLRALAGAEGVSLSNGQSDALSVYGSFNGSAGAGQNNGSLTVGQVFSTGVASQHLADGIRDSAQFRASADCLAALNILMAELVTKLGAALAADAIKALSTNSGTICQPQRPR